MFPDAIKNDPRVAAVQKAFPGAVITEVRRYEPSTVDESKITYERLILRMESERDRALAAVQTLVAEANASDQKSAEHRARLMEAASDRRQEAAEFAKIAQLMEWTRATPFIKKEFRIIASREAAEAAANDAEARDRTNGNNEP